LANNPKTVTTVIFDLDGVIVDTEPLNKLCLIEFLKNMGIDDPPVFEQNVQGLNTKVYWTVIKEVCGLKESVDELSAKWRPAYLDYLNELDVIPVISGIPDLVDYLVEENYSIGIASSANPLRIALILEKTGLQKSFSTIVCGDDVLHSKPAPDIYLLAAERLSAKPEECIAIEDSTNGVHSGMAAGMNVIGYGGSAHNTDDLSDAHIIVNDFVKLTQSLRSGEPFPV